MTIHGNQPFSPISQPNHNPVSTGENKGILKDVKFEHAPASIPARNSLPESPAGENPVSAKNIAEETSFPTLAEQPPPENDESMDFSSGTFIAKDDDQKEENFTEGTFNVKEDNEEYASGTFSGTMNVKDDDEEYASGTFSGTMNVKDDDQNIESQGSVVIKQDKPEKKEKAAPQKSAAASNMQFMNYVKAGNIAEISGEEHMAAYGGGAEAARMKAIDKRNDRLKNPQGPVDLQDKWVMEDPDANRLHKELTRTGEIIPRIQERRAALAERKEELRSLIQKEQQNPVDKDCAALYENIDTTTASIRQASGGQGGAYFGNGVIVKPKGESTLELNNSKGYAAVTVNDTMRVRDSIPLYQENEREVASYEMAKALNIGHITPPAVMAIITNQGFGDITDKLEPNLKQKITDQAGGPDHEKVITLQHMVKGGTPLMEIMDTWGAESAAKKEAANPGSTHTKADFNNFLKETIDQKSFEDASLACMFLGENDGNLGNFLAVPQENGKYSLVKIDNGLALPTQNQDFLNDLMKTGLAEEKLSDNGRDLIMNADPSKLAPIAAKWGLENTTAATTTRIETLKKIATFYPDISLKELNYRMSLLKEPNGTERALGTLTPTDQKVGKIKNPAKMELPQTYSETSETTKTETTKQEPAIKPLWQRKLELEEAANKRAIANQPKPQDFVEKGRVDKLKALFNK